jgi:hypothetical protein
MNNQMNNHTPSRPRKRVQNDYLTSVGFGALVLIFVLTSFISGCSRPNPTPEKVDPIYLDLIGRSSVAKAAAETTKEEIIKLREDLAALPARDPSRRKLQQDLSKKETQMMVADQEALYFEIRAQQRMAYARKAYLEAFDRGEKWPDPKDFEAYKLQRRLEDAPREWNARLQKTERYNRKSEKELRDELDAKLKPAKGH